MSIRLGDYVVYGELRNTEGYTTRGIVALRTETPGEEFVLHLSLTGNCDDDLRGRHFRFAPEAIVREETVFIRSQYPEVQVQQIGPTGWISAEGWVRNVDGPIEEFYQRSKLGEIPPTTWLRRLYIEWFSQNGRMVIELPGARIEECVRESTGDDDEGDWVTLPNAAPHPDTQDAPPSTGPELTVIRMEGGEAHVEHWAPREQDPDADEFDSVPDSLQRILDQEAAAVDRAMRGEVDDPDESTAELEAMDYCLAHSETVPVISILENTDQLPRPHELNDEEVEGALKSVLQQLAMLGVALDVCKHFTPRDCYELLLDSILPEFGVFTELRGTGWVQHCMTHEYCKDCGAQAEADFQ